MRKKTLISSLLAIGLLLAGFNAFGADGDLIVNGKVGIGTTEPSCKLEAVVGDGIVGSRFKGATATVRLYPYYDSTYGSVFEALTPAETAYVPFTFSGSRFFFNSGSVGIGTLDPTTYKLSVNGDFYSWSGPWTGSDARWKKNIEPIGNALSLIDGIQGVRYDWNAETLRARFTSKTAQGDTNSPGDTKIPGIDDRQISLIAQDVEKVLPELVKTDTDGYKAVSYEKLTAVLLQAVKELKAEVDKLKGK